MELFYLIEKKDNMKIFLRDINREIFNSWESVFIDYDDIDVSCGSIFDLTADVIISPANSIQL